MERKYTSYIWQKKFCVFNQFMQHENRVRPTQKKKGKEKASTIAQQKCFPQSCQNISHVQFLRIQKGGDSSLTNQR